MINLKDLARQLQCSHPTIEKTVILQTGFAFRKYKNIKKLERCSKLWKNDHCVKNIALKLGYKWPANFSRFFKDQKGISISKLDRTEYVDL